MANIEKQKNCETDPKYRTLGIECEFEMNTLRNEGKFTSNGFATTPKPSTPIICLKVLALLLPKVQKKMCVLQCIKMKGKGM